MFLLSSPLPINPKHPSIQQLTLTQGFLLTNFALTGLPLLLFIVFTITVFVFSLVAALLVGVLAALAFTVFMVGIALIIILPTVFMTTMGATFLFLWGLGGYYIVKWFNEDSGPAAEGEAIGDKLNALTGGKMSFLMDGARKKEAGEFDDVGGDGVSDIKDKAGEGVGGAMDGVKQRAGKGGGEKGEQQSEKKAEKEEANGGAKD